MDELKRCSMCKTISSKSNFHKDITKNDGYRSSCKFCSKKYYYNNQTRILNNQKTYKKTIDRKKRLMKDLKEELISISIYFVI